MESRVDTKTNGLFGVGVRALNVCVIDALKR